MTASEGSSLASSYKIAFHEISVAENPGQLDRLLNSAILQLRREEDTEQEKSRKQTLWSMSMSRVLSNILGGGRRSLPPELGGGDRERSERMSFKAVFKKRSV